MVSRRTQGDSRPGLAPCLSSVVLGIEAAMGGHRVKFVLVVRLVGEVVGAVGEKQYRVLPPRRCPSPR